jgi:hypothetical protein
MTTSYQYSLVVANDSQNSGTMCVYQLDQGLGVSGVQSLAWMAQSTNPTTRVVFSWNVCYDFVWYESGTLAPGILCVAAQIWPANLSDENQVTLTRNSYGPIFQNLTQGPVAGNLYIVQDGTIPAQTISAGIGMSESGTFVVQAQPNLTFNFQSPSPQYWLVFEQGDITIGTVIDPSELTGPQTQIAYPDNIYSMTATLNASNQWVVATTSEANAKVVASRMAAGRSRTGTSSQQHSPSESE